MCVAGGFRVSTAGGNPDACSPSIPSLFPRPSQPGATPTCGRLALRLRTLMKTSGTGSNSCFFWRSFQVRLREHVLAGTASTLLPPGGTCHPSLQLYHRTASACVEGWSVLGSCNNPYHLSSQGSDCLSQSGGRCGCTRSTT